MVQSTPGDEEEKTRYCTEELNWAIKNFFEKPNLTRAAESVENIHKAFEELGESLQEGEDISATVIASYIFHNISRESVRKRKASAYRFEEILCDMFNGKRVEDLPESQQTTSVSGFTDPEVKRRVKRNRLEKGDVIMGDLIVSAKTLVPTNLEINTGSFSSEALFKNFLQPVPQERQELGSKPALRKKFKEIKEDNCWEEFLERFRKMVRNIYYCEWAVGIKGHDKFTVYTMSSGDFQDLLLSFFENEDKKPTDFINRFEAHALRVDAKPFFNAASEVEIDLKGPTTDKLDRIDEKIEGVKLSALKFASGEIGEEELEQEISEIADEIKRITSGD